MHKDSKNMATTTQNSEEKSYIVRKVSMADTFRNLPVGKPVCFDCREVGPIATAYSAANRLRHVGEGDYRIQPHDNGARYTVTRLS